VDFGEGKERGIKMNQMEKGRACLFGFAERNDALLMTIEAEGGVGLIKEYKNNKEHRDDIQVKLIKKRIPAMEFTFALFKELLSDNDKEKFKIFLDLAARDKFLEINLKDIDSVSETLKRFSEALIKEQQKCSEMLKKAL